jgi:hypothetical protein
LESDKPVSRQFEEAYYGYYGWPMYGVPYMWGPYPYIVADRAGNGAPQRASDQGKKAWDHHLRSTHDVRGHNIQATDGEIGYVEGFYHR